MGKYIKGINDFASTHPELLVEWDYDLNTIKPEDVGQFFYGEAHWICSKCGKHYTAKIREKSIYGLGCNECKRKEGTRKRQLIAINKNGSLLDKYPVLCKEWDYEANEQGPEDYSAGSHDYVYWNCPVCQHSWKAQIKSRALNGRGCPNCALRTHSSFPEQAVLFYVKKAFPDAIGNYSEIFENQMELDVYIQSVKTGIEYDGYAWHNSKASMKRESRKYEICRNNGVFLIRIRERFDSDSELRISDKTVNCSYHNWNFKDLDAAINEVLGILNANEAANTEQDYIEIQEQYLTNMKSGSLEVKYPEIASEWDYEKNGELLPSMFTPGSNYLAHWKCQTCGYKWTVGIKNRTTKGGTGCPECAKKIVSKKAHNRRLIPGKTDLLSCFPEIASEWDYNRNGNLRPEDVTYGAKEKVYWRCSECGHVWSVSPNARTNHKSGCPACGNIQKIKSRQARELNEKGSLAEHFPDLLQEWDYELNGEIKPDMIIPHSTFRANWICKECGNRWITQVVHRTRDHSGCPKCSRRKARQQYLLSKRNQ